MAFGNERCDFDTNIKFLRQFFFGEGEEVEKFLPTKCMRWKNQHKELYLWDGGQENGAK